MSEDVFVEAKRKRGVFSRSFQLFEESLAVLSHDKEILVFPIISGIFVLIIFALFTIPFLFSGNLTVSESNQNSDINYLILFGYYLAIYFVIYFFNSALITCVKIRLSGGNPTVSDGFRNAFKHLPKIFLWALISAILGVVLRYLTEKLKFKKVAVIIASILGLVWSLLTFFVVPVLVLEGVGIKDAIKRSATIFKQTWKENAVLQLSVFSVFVLAGFLGSIMIVLAFVLSGLLGTLDAFYAAAVVFGSLILYWSMLAVIGSALNGIVLTALYLYATSGSVPQAFNPELIKNAFTEKPMISSPISQSGI